MPNEVKFNSDYPQISQSNALWERAQGLIPSGTQTLGKGPTQYTNGVAPKFLKKGKGARVWDVDGNEYLDYTMGLGPLSLGYCDDKINQAVIDQLKDGMTFSLMHPLEVEVAELMREVIPNAESVRFSKTGADVTTAAVRAARAFTGRQRVLCCGYHGWHDWYISVTDRNKGIPKVVNDLVFTVNYNDLESLKNSLDDDTACLIMEPTVFEAPNEGYLKEVKRLCEENGTLLIFDEMWTGFRLALGGAQEKFGVKADLATFSKAVANGMPLAVLTGRKDVMSLFDRELFFYTTFGGEALSLAAAKATIQEMKSKNVQAVINQRGEKLRDGYNELAKKHDLHFTKCFGFGCRSLVTFDAEAGNPLEMKTLVQQELIKRGILWTGFHSMSFSHTEQDVDYTLKAYDEVLALLKKAVSEKNVKAYLRGATLEPVFRKVGNFNTKPVRK